jgi:hypothetical protein
MGERHKEIWVYRGSSEESWLTVYEDGRIQLRSENDGVSVLRHGVQARHEWITLSWCHCVRGTTRQAVG